jgi:choline dehydrogenase
MLSDCYPHSQPHRQPRFQQRRAPLRRRLCPTLQYPLPSNGNYITVLSIVTSPTLRGTVMLNSSNSVVPPVIDLRHSTTRFDAYTAAQAIRNAFALLAAPSFAGYIASPYGPLAYLECSSSDKKLLEYVRQHGATISHSVGTANMSAYGADWGYQSRSVGKRGEGTESCGGK